MMEKRLNRNLLDAPRSAIRQFAALAAQTPGCISLTLGEPDFETPQAVSEAVGTALAAGKTHYIQNNGSPDLRRDIADFEHRTHGLPYTADEVIVTVGATEALYTALTGILEPGDEVIVPIPAFVLYQSIIGLAGARFVPLDTTPDGFQIAAEKLLALITPKTKAIVLNSPNNPTGCILSEESLRAVAEAAKQHDLFVVTDEVYRQLSYREDTPQFSTLYPDLKDRTIVVQSFSKPYAMTGWRVGYLMADLPVKAQLEKLHQFSVVSTASFVQDACRVALNTDVSDMVETYRRRRDYALGRIHGMKLPITEPEGAFYLFPDISEFGLSSGDFCTRMIREAGVAATPGFCFGSDRHIRLSYACSEERLEQGLDRLEQFISRLREER